MKQWKFGEGYEQEDPGHYIYDTNTGLVVLSSDTMPDEETMKFIAHAPVIAELVLAQKTFIYCPYCNTCMNDGDNHEKYCTFYEAEQIVIKWGRNEKV